MALQSDLQAPLVEGLYLLEKYPGKGGWTYVRIPEIAPDPHAHFGWVRVKGNIDHIAFEGFKLMPMGNGQLFFSVKKAWRKLLNKEAGDWVQIRLFADPISTTIDPAFEACLRDLPAVWARFESLSEADRNHYVIGWNEAKSETDKANWAAAVMQKLDV